MKFHGEDAPKSDQELLTENLQKQIDKSPVAMRFLGEDATILDALRQRVSIFEKYLNSLDITNEREIIMDLEYIIRLMREQIKLKEDLTSLEKIQFQKIQIPNEIEEGDEWKLKTGKNPTHEVGVFHTNQNLNLRLV